MIVSWNWLKEYVLLDMSVDELARRLMLAGLNHESTTEVGGDFAIDLEVTSNRPDCLGHIGIARETAVLYDRTLQIPAAQPKEGQTPIGELTSVEVACPQLCPRYLARVIRGVSIKPSPLWMTRRLATLGVTAINNVVDITNYVLFECGQPMHAFDLATLAGRRIIVRESRAGEKFEAINHQTYELAAGTCVIADAERAIALAGVMGGANTEISPATVDVLLESAMFDPLSVRNTSRHLKLKSDSSYRFERGVDPAGLDWASRRACALILDLAGGELAAGVIDVGAPPPERKPVVLRRSQLERVLGITIPAAVVDTILARLGNQVRESTPERVSVDPPSWRRDLEREIDLIEEVARIYGYEAIPEDVIVPAAAARRSDQDRVLSKVRHVLTALGYDEALTLSAVDAKSSEAFSPWTDAEPLRTGSPVLLRADTLRRSLIPSLLGVRRGNEAVGNTAIELFEIAKVYLPRAGKLPEEPWMIGLVTGGDFFTAKGVLEALLGELDPAAAFDVRDASHPLLHPEKAAELWLGGERVAILGEVSKHGVDEFGLRQTCTIAEIHLTPLVKAARLVPQATVLPSQPASQRDLNFVVDETVRWADLARVVKSHAGPHLEALEYRETYRHKEHIGDDKKSVLCSVTFRSPHGTLSGLEVETQCHAIVEAVGKELGGVLRA